MNRLMKRAGALIDAIRIKTITQEIRDGRECIVRKRGPGMAPLIRIANLFFVRAGNPARVCGTPEYWLKWEVDCFKLLNGNEALAFAEPPATVVTERLPGNSLVWHLQEGTFREEMLDSAAIELKRVHQLPCPELKGLWSHGDANLTNFLFDPATGRTRIIDFEIVHECTMPAEERHAEDLLVFLQDLVGCIDEERWLPAALRFIGSYGQPEVVHHLKAKLVVPGGIPRLWWWIRCNYIGISEMKARMEALRNHL